MTCNLNLFCQRAGTRGLELSNLYKEFGRSWFAVSLKNIKLLLIWLDFSHTSFHYKIYFLNVVYFARKEF